MKYQKEVFDLLKGTIKDKNQRKYCVDVEFFGLFSGDCECECIDVTRETFKKIMGKKPNRYNKSWVTKGLYRIYFSDIIGMSYVDRQKQCIIKINIEVEPLEKSIAF